jgi:hypothetical protein
MNIISQDEIEQLIRNAPPFRPFAIYEADKDQIRILTKNCSIIEYELDNLILLCNKRFGEPINLVGLVIRNISKLLGVSVDILKSIEVPAMLHTLIEEKLLTTLSSEIFDLINLDSLTNV